MADILHRVGIKSSSDEVYKALATREGLASWWTNDTQGESNVGGVIQFRFHLDGSETRRFRHEGARASSRQAGAVASGRRARRMDRHPVSWELKQDGEYSFVLFKHQGWKEPVEFMHHCSTKWAIYLMSLKSLVETGNGAPNPERHQDLRPD